MAIRSLKTGQFSRSALVGNPVIMPGSYESIATVTVGAGGGSSISFTSIPQTYSHLQLRIGGTANGADATLQLNGSSNSWCHILRGDGSVASTEQYSIYSLIDAGNASTSAPGVWVIDILDYTNTNKNKTVRTLFGYDYNGSGRVGMVSNLFNTTSAITSLSLTGRTWSQYSTFALYGVN